MVFSLNMLREREKDTHTHSVMNILSLVLKYLVEMADGISSSVFIHGWEMVLLRIWVCAYSALQPNRFICFTALHTEASNATSEEHSTVKFPL